ncbi:hypothetical protein [Methylobacterium sp. Leaf86]|uniref:hypothetical protein n=1 Tax=Methylobacterium sp. Leaf86 TaxID=1736242 RepID=UPI000A8EAA70|nr:hypothetical protein [Methylobacterium sp. Leaf86]
MFTPALDANTDQAVDAAACDPPHIVLSGRRWVNGLTWSNIATDLVVRKATAKAGVFAAHDLKLCPLVVTLPDKVPADRRVGPLILDETAGRPFAESAKGANGESSRRPQECRTMSGTWTPGQERSRKLRMLAQISTTSGRLRRTHGHRRRSATRAAQAENHGQQRIFGSRIGP